MTDKTLGACQCHEKHAPTYWKGVVREYKHALEKAEKERDLWRRKWREAEERAVRAEWLLADRIAEEMNR